MKTPKFLYWRGDSLWCRCPGLNEKPRFALGIRTTGTPADKQRCLKDAEMVIAGLRTAAIEGRLFDKKVEELSTWRPKFWRLIGYYWRGHLRYMKRSRKKRNMMALILKAFGDKYWDELTPTLVEGWLRSRLARGLEVSTVNGELKYIKATLTYAINNPKPPRKRIIRPLQGTYIPHNPLDKLSKIPGEKSRTFLLTPKKFERNYEWLKVYHPKFSVIYLACWMLGRRPEELAQYVWEQIEDLEVEGHHIHAIIISAESTKTGSLDVLPIPERLWQELIAQGWRSGFLFRNSHGDKWSNWMYQMGKLKEAFPIDDVGWFRDGRRGMATFNCDQQGLPRYAVKAVTGHKTTRMFDVYAIGTLKGKLMVTHPEFFRKDGGEGTNGAQLLQM